MLCDHPLSTLGDAVALALIDDWLVGNFVDTTELTIRKMGKHVPRHLELFPESTYDGRLLASHAAAIVAKRNEGFRRLHDASLAASICYIQTFLMKYPNSELMDYLKTLYKRRRFGSRQLTFEPIRAALPDGFSDSHVRLLIHQCNLYVYYRMPWTPYRVVSTFQYGAVPEAAVEATAVLRAGEMVSNLYGTTIAMTFDDEQILSSGQPMWDFSIISSSRAGYSNQLFLGPARFVNHDCEPNVKLARTNRITVGFKALRDILPGEEILTSYGDNYFGDENVNCLCRTCTAKQHKEQASSITQ